MNTFYNLKMTTDYNVLTFKAINTFINDLNEFFGSSNHSLQLYQRLIDKTTLSHEVAIQKHINAFKTFSISNREALMNKNIGKLESKIEYSNKVYIDIKSIMSAADKDTVEVIWKHLLTISAIVDPAGKAKDILKKNCSSPNESNFLENIINKVENNINPNSSNPTEAISSLLSSGIFNDLLSGMNNQLQDGSLDLGKLIGTVEKMCSTLNPSSSDGSGGGLNLSSLLSNVGPILNTLGQQQASGGESKLDLDQMMKQIISQKSSVVEESDP